MRGDVVCDVCGKRIDDEENAPITDERYEANNEPDDEDEMDEEDEAARANKNIVDGSVTTKKEDYEPENKSYLVCEFGKPGDWCNKPAKWRYKDYRKYDVGACKQANWLCDAHYNVLSSSLTGSEEAKAELTAVLAVEAMKNVQRIRWFKANGETIEEKPHSVTTVEVTEKVGHGFKSLETKTSTGVNGYIFYCLGVKEGERNVLATQYAKMFAKVKVAEDFEIRGNAILVETREDE